MVHSSQGIVRDEKGQEQPVDKRRAQTAHQTASKDSVSKEATRDPNSPTATRRPGYGAVRDDKGDGTMG
jgi:hypothetical protein